MPRSLQRISAMPLQTRQRYGDLTISTKPSPPIVRCDRAQSQTRPTPYATWVTPLKRLGQLDQAIDRLPQGSCVATRFRRFHEKFALDLLQLSSRLRRPRSIARKPSMGPHVHSVPLTQFIQPHLNDRVPIAASDRLLSRPTFVDHCQSLDSCSICSRSHDRAALRNSSAIRRRPLADPITDC